MRFYSVGPGVSCDCENVPSSDQGLQTAASSSTGCVQTMLLILLCDAGQVLLLLELCSIACRDWR